MSLTVELLDNVGHADKIDVKGFCDDEIQWDTFHIAHCLSGENTGQWSVLSYQLIHLTWSSMEV